MENTGLINLKSLSLEEIREVAVSLDKKPYSGRQLYKWIFNRGIDDFTLMTDLSKDFRAMLQAKYIIDKLNIADKAVSADGTIKTLWQTHDNLYIESVLIPDDNRLTLCMSSQAGCPLGCSFCATGKLGFKRNLSPGEIYDQFLLTNKDLAESGKITNIVFMGMGEPFLNYKNLLATVEILTNQLGAGLSSKKITVSTVGLVNGIYRLAEDNPGLKLAISLHSAIEEKRVKLIPVAAKNPLPELKKAAVYYAHKADNRVTFEYLLIKDINDSQEDAKALADFVRGIPCKINLITYNPVEGIEFDRPGDDSVIAFRDYLYPRTPAVTLRKSRGVDIAAACGQLAGTRENVKTQEDRKHR